MNIKKTLRISAIFLIGVIVLLIGNKYRNNLKNYVSPEEQQKQLIEDSEINHNISKDLQDTYELKPYLRRLPINTDQYLIIYDYNNNKIIVGVKDNYIDIDKAIEENQEYIEKILKEIGVPQDIPERQWRII